MPAEEYYEGLDLASAIEALAEHHHQPRTRHLAFVEYELLLHAAEALRGLRTS